MQKRLKSFKMAITLILIDLFDSTILAPFHLPFFLARCSAIWNFYCFSYRNIMWFIAIFLYINAWIPLFHYACQLNSFLLFIFGNRKQYFFWKQTEICILTWLNFTLGPLEECFNTLKPVWENMLCSKLWLNGRKITIPNLICMIISTYLDYVDGSNLNF